ncbi:sesquipedalian-1 [Paramormyrops kingsleyae]|uniref:Sesquipedalian n=1 Tax=Paramormyrops kingsleyae TaxID=1676925 RepID=A0A3B3TE95_9TELE|nr:sesquipedalian-1-like [Paramormyrops kingsleyae]
MKIHGSILRRFWSCCSPVDKHGYLYRKEQKTGSYKKHWFVLKGNLLFYQEQPGDSSPLGVIVLEGCSIQLCDSEGPFAFSVVYGDRGQWNHRLAGADEPTQQSWVKVLLAASHGFLSMLVRDLERQYKDMGGIAYPSESLQLSTGSRLEESQLTCSLGSKDTGYSFFRRSRGPLPKVGRGYTRSLSFHALHTSSWRSPKLWKKTTIHITPVSRPAPPCAGPEPLEDFCTLHELYGQEVKTVMATWRERQNDGEVQEGDMTESS